MTSRIRCRRLLPLVFLILFLPLGGCKTPDRWHAWQDDDRIGRPEQPETPVSLPESLQPRLSQPPSPTEADSAGLLRLSVEQAVMMALANNRDLRAQQFGPVIAGTFEQIERGAYDPELFASLDYDEERASETSRSTGEQFDVKGRDTASVVGLRQRIPTGTTVEATVEHDRNLSSRTPEQQTARLGLSVTQALLRGFGPGVNLVRVRQAELETTASLYELRGFTQSLLAETEITYWHFVFARESIRIFERSLAVARQQMEEIEKRIEVGVLPAAEAAAARAQVAGHEQALIDARSLLEERRLRLLKLISPGSDGGFDRMVHAVSDPHIEPQPIRDLEDRLQLADRSRPDLEEARLRLEQNRLETVLTRNGLLPKLDLFVVLGKTGYADSFAESFQALDGDTYDAAVGVRLSQYIGNRTAKARDLAARASRDQAREALANLRQIVRLDVRLAVNELERSRQQISASRVTRTFREQTLAAEKQRFDVGVSTSLLVAQAQRELISSQIDEVEAIVGYRIALVRLYLSEGSLLERRGVLLADGGVSATDS
ncbi:MAG: TolC family protein [Desulfobacteraceae bacterium]|nr:TolC family protein [Desulfobacteraceae bacterium]